MFGQNAVDALIVGTTSVEHLEQAVAATETDLSDGDLAYLAEPYEPVPVSGHERAGPVGGGPARQNRPVTHSQRTSTEPMAPLTT